MKVAVLAGGRSLERAVSQMSGARVEGALRRLDHEVEVLDADHDLGSALQAGGFDCAFIALHGRGGEDGTVQELLELAGIPYTGATPLACASSCDKALAKEALRQAGLPTPPSVTVSAESVRALGADALLDGIAERVGLPLVVKPARGGSAIGVRRVDDEAGLADALLSALAYDDRVVVEAHVDGREIAVAIVRGRALPPVEAIPRGADGYDFDARYTPGETDFVCPADVGPEVSRIALTAAEVLGCQSFARVDLLVPEHGPPQILEVNVVPGLTETSLVPIAAQAAGLTFDDVVSSLVADAVGSAAG